MKNLVLLLCAAILLSCAKNPDISVQSPDNKINIRFGINDDDGTFYSVTFEDSVIIAPSRLGFEFEGAPPFGKNLEITNTSKTTFDKTWIPVYGERSEIPDNFNQLRIHLKETTPPEREFEITFRAYNEGVALNYTLLPLESDTLLIQKELTEFNLPENCSAWVAKRAQAEYRKIPVNEITQPAERPLVIEAGEYYLSIGEARLVDFARMKLKSGRKNNSLVASLFSDVKITLPYFTPWRTVMIGKSPGELLENDYFILNLNEPCAIKDISWIKPGKVIRETTLTTKGGLACVDFAAEKDLQYVEFDAGWYGPEGDEKSDASTITVDPKRSPGPLDLHRVIDYANSRGIGIIVYVNRRALEKQIDEILPLYHSWGIKGVKYGFVQVGSQKWTAWLHEAVKKAAENRLMVDIHDEYRPTGFSRTYPNLMTQEGIRGDEESPSNQHTLITLFTRMLAGAGDNTICYFAPRVMEEMGGRISQLAKAVMLYSPWQFLFWYDRPPNSSDVPGGKGFIQQVPELEFFREIPTIWDDTNVLEGKIGEFATVVRKSGDDWFLGSLTGEQSRTLNLHLYFLDNGMKYVATVYSYDPDAASPTNVKIENREVGSGSNLKFEIDANSGLAIHFQLIE